jgi:hypothetical protein
MAKAKKTKPPVTYLWRVSLIAKTPQRYLGRVEAATEEEATEAAVKEFGISAALHNRILVQRE